MIFSVFSHVSSGPLESIFPQTEELRAKVTDAKFVFVTFNKKFHRYFCTIR